MATADSVKAKMQGLINSANTKTGAEDTTLSAAMNTLIAGYGQGGSGGGESDGSLFYDFINDTIPNNKLTLNLETIDKDAIRYKSSLHEIELPNCITINETGISYNANLSVISAPKLQTLGNAALRNNSFVSVTLPMLTTLGQMAFSTLKTLEAINCPVLENTAYRVFENCTALHSVEFPRVTALQGASFLGCTALEKIVLPSVTKTGGQEFQGCTKLHTVDFHQPVAFGNNSVFLNTALAALILRGMTISSTAKTNIFSGTPIESGTGYIYVPATLVDAYKTETNWTIWADQFRALEDYTVDGTITGELDESKIGVTS